MIDVTIGGVEMTFETEPGLFSPDRIDAGTLAMLSCAAISPGDKVLDLGCGYGVVGVYAARIAGPGAVWMVDSDPAAVACARRNAEANSVAGVTIVESVGFQNLREAGFTKILSNPPYHADFSVPKHFIEKGFNRLAIGGTLWMVTKRDGWYRNKLTAIFGGVRVHAVGGYFVFEAVRRSANYARAGPG